MELREALARPEVFDALEAQPIKYANQKASALVTTTSDPNAQRMHGEELLAMGFRYVGTTRESMPHHAGTDVDTFIDAESTTVVVIRRGPARARLYAKLSRYYILSLLDDGTLVETVSRPDPVNEGPRLLPRPGTDDLVADVSGHRSFLLERADAGARIVPVPAVADVLRLKRYMISHAIGVSNALSIVRVQDNEKAIDGLVRDLWVYGLFLALAAVAGVLYLLRR